MATNLEKDPGLDTNRSGKVSSETTSVRRSPRPWAVAVGLLVIITALAAFQAVWISQERSGFAIDVDESGYLDHAVQALNRATSHDIGSVWSLYFDEHYVEAPLLSLMTVPVLIAGTPGLSSGLMTQVIVLVILLLVTFLLARRLIGGPWGLLAVAMVGLAPGVVNYTRSYQFALLSAAMLTASVACLVLCERFTRTWAALAWGLFLGLMLLSRTMMVAMAPGIILAAMIAALVPGPSRRDRIARLAVGLAITAGVAIPWWRANWTDISDYLTGYGFGGFGDAYGRLYAPTEAFYYLRVPYRLAYELYLPLTILVGVGLFVLAVHTLGALRRLGVSAFLGRTVDTGHLPVVVVVVAGVAALMSSRNNGTGFVLPLIPLVVVLSVLGVSRVRWSAVRFTLTSLLVLTLVAGAVMKSGISTPLSAVRAASLSGAEGPIPITDGRSRYETYLSSTDYAPDEDPSSRVRAVLGQVLARRRSPDAPVLAVQNGDHLFNGNLLGLLQDVEGASPLAIWGLPAMLDPSSNEVAEVIEGSAGNAPTEFLLTVDLAPPPASFPGAVATTTVEQAARSLGFEVVATMRLTPGRSARLWQRPSPQVASP